MGAATTRAQKKEAWIDLVASAENGYHTQAAAEIKSYQDDSAAIERGSLAAIAPIEYAFSVAAGSAENTYRADQVGAWNRRRTDDMEAIANNNDADHAQFAIAMQSIHMQMQLPWTDYQAALDVAMRDWWVASGRGEVETRTSRLNAASNAYQTAVATARTTFVSTASGGYRDFLIAFGGITEARTQGHAAVNHTYAGALTNAEVDWHASYATIQGVCEIKVATAERDLVATGNHTAYMQALNNATQERAAAQAITDVQFILTEASAAGVRWITEQYYDWVFAGAVRTKALALANIVAPAKETFATAEANAYAELQAKWADAQFDFEAARAASLAAALEALDAASATPWSKFDSAVALAELDYASALYPAEKTLRSQIAVANAAFQSEVADVACQQTVSRQTAPADHQHSLAEAEYQFAIAGAAADEALVELGYTAAWGQRQQGDGNPPGTQGFGTRTRRLPKVKDPVEAERIILERAYGFPEGTPWFTIRAHQWWNGVENSVWHLIVGKTDTWQGAEEHGEELREASLATLWPKYTDFGLPYAGPSGQERWELGKEAAVRSKLSETEEGKKRVEAWEYRRKVVADVGSSIVPGPSEYRDVRELLEGEDLVWREKFSTRERVLQAGGTLLPLVPGRITRLADDAAEIAVDAAGRFLRRYADDYVEAIAKFEKRNPGWKWTKKATSGENSELLRKNLGDPTGDANYAHHILASTHPDAEEARQILERYRIDINSKENGVYLTKHQHEQTHLHTKANVAAISQRISILHDIAVKEGLGWEKVRSLLQFELSQIKVAIVDGKFPPSP